MNLRALRPLCLVFFLVPLASRADDAAPAPAPAPPATSPAEGAAPAGHRRGGYVLAELTAKLGLSVDQVKTVGALIDAGRAKEKALRADDSLDPQAKRAQMREIAGATRESIRAALTPAQQAIFDTLKPQWGGHRAQGAGAQTPPPAEPAAPSN